MSPARPDRRRAVVLLAIPVVLLLLAAAVLWSARGHGAPHASVHAPRASQLRPAPTTVPPARQRARRAAAARLGRGGVLDVEPATGGVRSLARLDGLLTGPHRGSPARVVLRYVRAHQRIFGLSATDLRGLRPAASVRSGALTHLRWRQEVRGVPLLDADLRATVTRDGRIVSVGGGAAPGLAAAVGSVRPALDGAEAMAAAARATGDRPAGGRGDGGARTVRFGGDLAELAITTATGSPRLAWHVVRRRAGDEVVDQLIDARTGKELRRFDRQRAAAVMGRYFPAWPGAPSGGQATDVDLSPYLEPGLNQLFGPRAYVFADLNGNGKADAGEDVAPDANGQYLYDRKPFWQAGCPTGGCAWDPTTARSWQGNVRQAATNLFVQLQRYADYLAQPPISFSEFHDGDLVVGKVMVGADGANGLPADANLNNASMYAPRAGEPNDPPQMSMYLFNGNAVPALDGADDASVIFHEYSHGLNARSVVDGLGWSALGTAQAGALDEGLADFWSLDRVVELGLMPDGAQDGDLMVGRGVDPHGMLRSEGTDCPVQSASLGCLRPDLKLGGFTYGDFGHIHPTGHPEAHDDGEIVTQTLWQLRQRLVAEHGQAQALPLLRGILVEALRSVPPEPSFLDLRNALLEADRALHGGSTADDIWAVFAERGMGYGASTREGDDIDPIERFDLPPATPRADLTGVVRDRATGEPLAGAEVAIGGHDTGRTNVDDFRATTDAEGRYRIGGVPAGTYAQLLVHLRPYEDGAVSDVRVTAEGGTADVTLRRNWADVAGGAHLRDFTGPDYSQYRCGPDDAIDGDRTSSWMTTAAQPGEPARSITIELPQALRVTSFTVEPTPRKRGFDCPAPYAPRDGAWPNGVRVEVSHVLQGDGDWETAARLDVSAGRVHRVTELRPVAPIDGVRRVRVELDNPSKGPWLHLAELQVFASPHHAPRAALASSPAAPDVQESITLDASASRPGGDAVIARYQWDLDGDGAEHAAAVRAIGPRAVSRTVLLRLARLPKPAAAVARAVAVLGERPGLTATAELAGTDEAGAVEAIAALARAEILRTEEPLGFVHPLVRDAVYGELPAARRAIEHARAARLLAGLGASPERVAAQLMLAPPRGDAWVVERLREAAAVAISRGAPDAALAHLQRAQEEPPWPDVRTPLALELGAAAEFVRGPAAVEALRHAYGDLTEPVARGEAAIMLARTLLFMETPREAMAVVDAARAELPAEYEDLHHALWAIRIVGVFFGVADPSDLASLDVVRAGPRGTGPGAKTLTAITAFALALQSGDAREAAALAREALHGDEMPVFDRGTFTVLPAAAMALAEPADAEPEWRRIRALAGRRGSVLDAIGVDLWGGLASIWTGDLQDATASLERAQEGEVLFGSSVSAHMAYSPAFLALAWLERGDRERAWAELRARGDHSGPSDGERFWLTSCAELLLADGELGQVIAIADQLAATRPPDTHPLWSPWRSLRARAAQAAGDRDGASRLAAEELELARRSGAPWVVGRGLRQLGALAGDAAALREAVSLLDGTSARLERAKAHAALGDALGDATAWRTALALAERCGADELAARLRSRLGV